MSGSAVVDIVLPVFCFIGIGYLVVATRLLGESVADGLAAFVFVVPVPLLLFRATATLDVPDFNPWPFWGAYFAGAALNTVIGVLVVRLFGRDGRTSVIGGMSAAFANTVMVGMPLVATAYGEAGLVVVLTLIAVHLPIMMAVSAVMIEVAEGAGGRIGMALRRVALGLVKNPMIVAIAAGLLYRATGLPLGGMPRTVIDAVAETAIPLALMALGMSLHRYGVRGTVAPAAVLSIAKLLIMPAVVYLLGTTVFDLPPIALAVAVTVAAAPTGANAYLIATRFQTGLALSANTITLTTAVAVVSLGFWISLFLP
ncbi:MAG: AEC family transporter [Pseudomonadota bacterium]